MNTFLLIGLLLLSLFALLLIFAWLFAKEYCKPRRVKSRRIPKDFSLPAVNIQLNSEGKHLQGWLIGDKAPEIERDIVILVHGWSVNMTLMLPISRYLYNSGFDVLIFDCRGHGQSEDGGPITLIKMAQDINSAIDFAYNRVKNSNKTINLLAHSMGASAAILSSSQDKRVKSLVAISPFADPRLLTKRYMISKKIPTWGFINLVFFFIHKWLGVSMDKISPLNRLKQMDQNALFIHGNQDHTVPYNDTVTLLEKSGQKNHKLLLVEEKDHLDILRDANMFEDIVSFYRKIDILKQLVEKYYF